MGVADRGARGALLTSDRGAGSGERLQSSGQEPVVHHPWRCVPHSRRDHGSVWAPQRLSEFSHEERSRSTPEWNHYRIDCNKGVLRLSVNGKEVSGGEHCNYSKGYIGLESEGGPIDFRNVRIKELPPSGAPAERIAPMDLGWRPLFTGLDFRGWATNAATLGRWSVRGETLALQQGPSSREAALWTEADFGDFELVVDCRPGKPPIDMGTPTVRVRQGDAGDFEMRLTDSQPGQYRRFLIALKGRDITVTSDGKEVQHLTLPATTPARGKLGLVATDGAIDWMNLYVRDLPSR